jgi:hypothetical protein
MYWTCVAEQIKQTQLQLHLNTNQTKLRTAIHYRNIDQTQLHLHLQNELVVLRKNPSAQPLLFLPYMEYWWLLDQQDISKKFFMHVNEGFI